MHSARLRVGMVVLLLLWALWDCLVDSVIHPGNVCDPGIPIPGPNGTNTTMPYDFWDDPVIHVYKFCAAGVLMMWAMGVLLLIRRRGRVNVMYIFDLRPGTSYTNPDEVFRTATNLTAIAAVNFLLFYKIHRGDFFERGNIHTINRFLPFRSLLFASSCLRFPFAGVGRLDNSRQAIYGPLHGVTLGVICRRLVDLSRESFFRSCVFHMLLRFWCRLPGVSHVRIVLQRQFCTAARHFALICRTPTAYSFCAMPSHVFRYQVAHASPC